MRIGIGVLLLGSAGMMFGQQQQFWQPEVRRAVPVEKPTPTPGQAPKALPVEKARPVERALPVEKALPVERALPVEKAFPVEKPVQTPRPAPSKAPSYPNPAWMERVKPTPSPVATPAPEPVATPYRPQGRIEVAPKESSELPPKPTPSPEAENGEIRLSPSSQSGDTAAQEQLKAANSIYSRKMYDYAIMEYEKFLVTYPSAEGGDMAMFRLAESHRMLGNEEVARSGYERLLQAFRKGEFAGAAAYRLGEYLYADKKYDLALIQFRLAAAESAGDEVRLSAKYNAARALDRLKRPNEAEKLYEEVSKVENNNPYHYYARLSLAESAAASGRRKEALEAFSELSSGSAPPAVRAEAAVKAAALAAELGDKQRALKLFNQAFASSESGDWKPMAFLGAIRLNFELGDYKKVVEMSEKAPADIPNEERAEILLLTGNSYRQLGNARAARAIYERLLFQFPNSPSSPEARFHRLLSLYQLDDPRLMQEADDFIRQSTDPLERAQASLLKAESLFKQKKYAEAGPIYARLGDTELAEALKTKALYKLGWCQAQTGDYTGAIKTYTQYIEKNPGSPTLPSAIAQRGLAYQQNKQYDAALKDFDLIIDSHEKAPERELALQQKALVLGQQNDYKGMTATFAKLLEAYPKTSAGGQANFWIGWAAFEEKDYKRAIEYLEIARKLDAPQYGERATLRIILCYYYLQDLPSLRRTVSENKGLNIPAEITRWLGRKSFEEGDYAATEQYLLPVAKDAKDVDPTVLIELAEAQIRQGKSREAAPFVTQFLEAAREPYSRARGLQAMASVSLDQKNFDEAAKLCDESLLLQPEGQLNAEGRLLSGEISYARGDYDGAARAFMTVAVLYNDASVAPRALRRAVDAYRKANNEHEAEKALQELQQRFPDIAKSPTISKEH